MEKEFVLILPEKGLEMESGVLHNKYYYYIHVVYLYSAIHNYYNNLHFTASRKYFNSLPYGIDLQMEKYCPQLYMDGTHNVWIVKPGASSRGRGQSSDEDLEAYSTSVWYCQV